MARSIEDKWVADFVISESRLYRSREVITVPAGVFSAGALLTAAGAAATAANVDCILLRAVNATAGAVRAPVLARDAEVNDGYILYGALDRATVNTRLAGTTSGIAGGGRIIVRSGVLSTSEGTSFAVTAESPATDGEDTGDAAEAGA